MGEGVCLQGGLSLGGSVSRKVCLWGGGALYPGGLHPGGGSASRGLSPGGGDKSDPLRNKKSGTETECFLVFCGYSFLFWWLVQSHLSGCFRPRNVGRWRGPMNRTLSFYECRMSGGDTLSSGEFLSYTLCGMLIEHNTGHSKPNGFNGFC